MTTETMTIHKALCELKTIDDRIHKELDNGRFVFANKAANKVVWGLEIDKFCENQKSKYQRVTDLIARKNAIKRGVITSNATTKVTIAGKEYSVAEAIYMKQDGISLLQAVLTKLDIDNQRAQRDCDQNNGENLEQRADTHVATLYSNYDKKDMSEAMKKDRDDFIKAQKYVVIDPIDVNSKMDDLRDRIDSFIIEIDSALSVSNALTEITIEY